MTGNRPVPDAILERYALDELPPREMEALRSRLKSEAGLRRQLAALHAGNEDILKAYSPVGMAEAIATRRRSLDVAGEKALRSSAPWYRKAAFAAPAGLALAVVLALMVRPDGDPPLSEDGIEAPENHEVRLKGSESGLAIYRKTKAGGTELIPPQTLARDGDELQVYYHNRSAVYGLIFSLDGFGSVTLHLPESAGPAPLLQKGDMLPLPYSFRLDRAPSLERFFLVTSPAPFSSETTLAHAQAAFAVRKSVPDSLEGLADGFRQYTYTLLKPGAKGKAGKP